MSETEAYEALAKLAREVLSKRKLELYAKLRAIEELDELTGYALVRRMDDWDLAMNVNGATVRATDEQKDAFFIYENQTESRRYIDAVIRLLERVQS